MRRGSTTSSTPAEVPCAARRRCRRRRGWRVRLVRSTLDPSSARRVRGRRVDGTAHCSHRQEGLERVRHSGPRRRTGEPGALPVLARAQMAPVRAVRRLAPREAAAPQLARGRRRRRHGGTPPRDRPGLHRSERPRRLRDDRDGRRRTPPEPRPRRRGTRHQPQRPALLREPIDHSARDHRWRRRSRRSRSRLRHHANDVLAGEPGQ